MIVSESLARLAVARTRTRWERSSTTGSWLAWPAARGRSRSRIRTRSRPTSRSSPAICPSLAVVVKTSGRPEDALLSVASIARALDPDVFPEVQLLKASFRAEGRADGAQRARCQPARLQRAAARLRGHCRPRGLLGRAAHEGDRHPDGARRDWPACPVRRPAAAVSSGCRRAAGWESAPQPRCRRSCGGSCTASAASILRPTSQPSPSSSRSWPSQPSGPRDARFASARCRRFAATSR